MIKYEEFSEAIYVLRRKPVLVIYHGTKTSHELKQLDKLKGFVFLSDQEDPKNCIAGIHCSGLIIEEDVEVSDHSLEYSLTRLRHPAEHLILHMNRRYKEQIGIILEKYTEQESFDYVKKMKERLGVGPFIKLVVEE